MSILQRSEGFFFCRSLKKTKFSGKKKPSYFITSELQVSTKLWKIKVFQIRIQVKFQLAQITFTGDGQSEFCKCREFFF